MKTAVWTKLFAAVAICGATSMALPQNVAISQDGRPENMNRIPPRQGVSHNDIRFMHRAAEGHLFEIRKSELALQRATDPWTREFARDMIREHSLGYEQLKLLARDKNVSLPSQVSPEQSNHLRRLGTLQGAAFDRAYRQIQAVSHQQAENTYEWIVKHGHDSMVRNYAVTYLPGINMHQRLMAERRTMLREVDARVRRETHMQRQQQQRQQQQRGGGAIRR
jgi:putative membrane protein